MTARRSLAALAVLTLSLSACGIQLEPPRGEPPRAEAGAVAGGTLRIGITAPGRIDPIGAATPGARMITQAMCDTLVALDPVTRQVVPGLVKNWVEADAGSYLTFLPLHDLTFHNGARLGAQDLDESMKALLAQFNGSPYRQLAKPFAGGILGSDQEQSSGINPLLVEGADTTRHPAQPLNDYDVQIKSHPANAAAVRILTDPAFAPVSRTAMAEDFTAFTQEPACVGPYRLTEPYTGEATTITLERNPDYPAKNLAYSAGGRGYADTLVFEVFPDEEAAYQAYQDGQVDVVAVPGTVAGDPEQMPAPDSPDIAVGTATRMDYLGIPVDSDDALKSPVVRRALSLALDRTTLSELTGLGASPATGFLPPSLAIEPGAQTSLPGMPLPACTDAIGSGANVELARQILADAGISLEGETIHLQAELSERHRPVLEEIARQWEEAFGVTVEPPFDVLWDDYSQLSRFGFGFDGPFRFTWGTDGVVPIPGAPEVQTYLEQIFVRPRAENTNWTGWSSRTFEDRIRTGLAVTSDQRTRGQILAELGQELCTEMPYLPLTNSVPAWLIRDGAVGSARTVRTGVDGLPLLRELYLRPPGDS